MIFVGRGRKGWGGVWRLVARGGSGCDEVHFLWTAKHVLWDVEAVQALPKTLKVEYTSWQQKYFRFVSFYILFSTVVQVRERRVLMLWVLVVVWGPGAQSCRVLLQILRIILILMLFMLYSHGCMFHERHVL